MKHASVMNNKKRNIPFNTTKVPIVYSQSKLEFAEGLRLNILVDNRVILELKLRESTRLGGAITFISETDQNKSLGYLSFYCTIIKDDYQK